MGTDNPFHYGTPVEGEHFVGRESEVNALVSRVRNHINVVLLSPRRYGKTSVLLRAERELVPTHPAIVHVNLFRHRDAASLAGALASGAYHLPGARWHRGRQAVSEFVGRLRVRPSVTFSDDGRPRFQFGPTLDVRDLDAVLGDVVALLDDLAEDKPVALVLDEFQAITDFDAHLPSVLKALLDEHPHVSLVAAGSKQHLMEQLFVERNAPLYNMAERIALGPIPENDMIEFLCRRASAGRKSLGAEAARLIVDMAGPVPDDVQHLGFEAFEVARMRRQITAEDVRAGLSTAVGRLEHLYRDVYELLPLGQRRVLYQLAVAPTSMPSGVAFVRRADLANASSVRKALDGLATSELIVTRGAMRTVSDPFFAAWLRGDDEGGS